MDPAFHNIAGILTDGSTPLNGEGLAKVISAGAPSARIELNCGDEFAFAGLSAKKAKDDAPEMNGAPANFLLARGAARGPFEQWSETTSVSQFGEGGAGAWAAVRAFPDAQKFWLARDQFGQQPLYVAEKGATTAFATDLKWFFESGFLPAEFNAEAFAELVQLQFLSGSTTAFNGVRRVFPGETLVVERGRVVDRLRRPVVPHSDRRLVDRAVAFDALDDEIAGAIDKTLEGVRLIGCVISGDLASTALAIAIARGAKRRVRAYIPYAEEPGIASYEPIADFARGLGFEPVAVEIGRAALFDDLPQIVKSMADPVGDQAALVWNCISEAAREDGATLVMPGGGQEVFGAYGRYRTAARPLWLGGRAMRGRGHLQGLPGVSDGPTHWRDGLLAVENRLRGSTFTRIQLLQLLDIATWLPNDVLLGQHQVTSGAGVDVRHPYLDPDLASFAFALSDGLKLRGQDGGVLLHHWIHKTFPSAEPLFQLTRAGMPLGRWIGERANEFGPAVEQIISRAGSMPEGRAARIFEQTAQKQTKRLGMAAWQLLYFALWYRIHIEGAAADGDTLAVLSD